LSTLFIISGPSGSGKSTLAGLLVERLKDIRFSISHTTRAPRGKEQNGVHYFYVDADTFEKMINENALAEHTHIYGNYYGTSHEQLRSILADEGDLILEIEGDGAVQIQKQYPEAVSIFVLPPSLDELKKRICGRAEDSSEQIARRMANALKEIEYIDHFDYVVVNDEVDSALDDLISIVIAHRRRKQFVWKRLADRFKG
jgi:guanylate kinase